jgi:hypothetical protein
MPKNRSQKKISSKKAVNALPEWAKKVKTYREEAGKTQVATQKAIKAKVNTMTLVETGRRNFSPVERQLFFEFIGKPEDTSIPIKVRTLRPATSKKVAKSAKPARPGKTSKVDKTPLVSAKKDDAPTTGSSGQKQLPAKNKLVSPSVAGLPAISKVEGTEASTAISRQPRKNKTKQGIPNAPLPITANGPSAPGAMMQASSPVKEAALRDITRIFNNPNLSDNQARRLHGLFTSLAVNALLGE